MKIRNYIKKRLANFDKETYVNKTVATMTTFADPANRKIFMLGGVALLTAMLIAATAHKELCNVTISEENLIPLTQTQIAAASGKKDVIAIPSGVTKANPFLPYRDIGSSSALSDVPAYNLVEPPEMVNENSDAARVMDTVVSGILYDKFSPSAILNIEGNDYLVKKGDTVNNYKVVNIMQDSVTVKLGANVYKAGIGEILTEGSLNHNEVSNLNNKFGGERR